MDEYSILKKKRKKNAFAATSLLISIALALLVLVGAVLILGKVDDNAVNDDSNVTLGSGSDVTCVGLTKEMVFKNNIREIKEAAISYFTNERLPQTVGTTFKITLREMLDDKLVLNIIDGSNKLCSDDQSYVEVTKEKDEYVMKIFLSCSDMEDYIIVHLGCYDYCESNICEKKEEVVKEYEYEYKKTTNCIMSDWSAWGNWKTTREQVSNLKKEDTKVETSSREITDVKNATKKVTYNCDKYPGYTLDGTKCVKTTTTTDTKDATPSKYSYNCDKYPGYTLDGTKCVKTTTTTDTKDATVSKYSYNCDKYPGYTLDGTKCIKKTSTTDTKNASVTYNCDKYTGYTLEGDKCVKTTTDSKNATKEYNCDKYSGYTLSGTKCVKTTKSTKDAEPVYETRKKTEKYTCYKQECTTTVVFKCPQGKPCGNYPQTSCENVRSVCKREVDEQYVSGYTCSDKDYELEETKDGKKVCVKTTTSSKNATKEYNCDKYTGYTLDGTKCVKTTTSSKNATKVYNCDKYTGYTLDGKKCVKTTTTTDSKNATKVPSEYTCPSGYTLSGTKCSKTTTKTDTKDATKVSGGYVCPSGYTISGTKCSKTTTKTDTKDATSKTTYTCLAGYTRNNDTCTKKTTETVKTTYYRYATRSCDGGSTSTKWSTSQNDTILKSEGYKLTGNKRAITGILK